MERNQKLLAVSCTARMRNDDLLICPQNECRRNRRKNVGGTVNCFYIQKARYCQNLRENGGYILMGQFRKVLERATQGDAEAIKELYKQYQPINPMCRGISHRTIHRSRCRMSSLACCEVGSISEPAVKDHSVRTSWNANKQVQCVITYKM